MNLIQYLATKLHQGPVFINPGRNSLQDEFSEGLPKSVVSPIVRLRQATLGLSGTGVHSILHEHLTVKKIC